MQNAIPSSLKVALTQNGERLKFTNVRSIRVKDGKLRLHVNGEAFTKRFPTKEVKRVTISW